MRWLALFPLLLLPSGLASELDTWKAVEERVSQSQHQDALNLLLLRPTAEAAADPEHEYNVGTLALTLKKTGLARAYLEAAALRHPMHRDLAENLDIARTELEGLLGRDHLDPGLSDGDLWLMALTHPGWRLLLPLLVAAGALLTARGWKRPFNAAPIAPGATLLGIGLLLSLSALARRDEPPGYLTERAIVRSGPGEQHLELGVVEAGMGVRVLEGVLADEKEPNRKWRQVHFSASGVGWVPASSLLVAQPRG